MAGEFEGISVVRVTVEGKTVGSPGYTAISERVRDIRHYKALSKFTFFTLLYFTAS